MVKSASLSLCGIALGLMFMSACSPAPQPTNAPISSVTVREPTTSPTTSQPTLTPRPTRAPTATPARAALKTPRWFDDVVLYEVFPRSFYDTNNDGTGDLNGITAKLDYLQALGVGAIWLTPIFESPSYHGYDTTDYYKVNPQFGTEDDLRTLVSEAHKRNIRVLLDYVVAHSSNRHPFFQDAYGNLKSKYADWFRWTNAEHTKYESYAGNDVMPTWNHDNPDTANYLIGVAKYWMKTGIDGYRADYVLNVPHSFWKKLRAEVKSLNPDFLLLAEAWTSGRGIQPYYDDEFDAAFDFPLYGDIQGSNDKVGDSILLGTQSPALLDGTLKASRVLYPPNAQLVEFINNHDTDRAMSEVQGDLRRAKLGATLLLTLPNTPMIYYGEEIGLSGQKAPAPDYDKTRREPMKWSADLKGKGMATWFTFYNKSKDGISVEEQLGKPDSLLEHYRLLVALRNANPALRSGALETLAQDNPKVYTILRYEAQTAFVVVINFDDKPASIALDLGLTGLPDGKYQAKDALTNRTFAMDGLYLKLDADAATGYVIKLVK